MKKIKYMKKEPKIYKSEGIGQNVGALNNTRTCC